LNGSEGWLTSSIGTRPTTEIGTRSLSVSNGIDARSAALMVWLGVVNRIV